MPDIFVVRFACSRVIRSVRHSSLVLLTLLGCLSAARSTPAQENFAPMFTDTDMSGWVRTNTPRETWRFEDGVLYCTGKPIGEIRTERMYQNFVMELEWRHMVPRGNAGVFVWADDLTSRGVPFHRGIEVQVLENEYGNNDRHTTHGDIFPIHGATMTPLNGRGGSRAFPTENRSRPSPQWNHYRIECLDGAISLAVNGKVVTRGENCVPRKGYICLESEGGVVEYRNIRIRQLPAGDLPPEQVAIADRGYHSLYTGLNLDGWETDNPSRWTVKDWVLAFNADGNETGVLSTDRAFQDASFVVDVRLKRPTSNVVIRSGDALRIDLSEAAIAAQLEPTGRWNRIEWINREGKPRLEINGNPLKTGSSEGAIGGKLELEASGPVDLANLFAAEK